MSYVRTPEHRALRAQLIRAWKPWEKSTGPLTAQGKIIVARNAIKHNFRSQATKSELVNLKKILHTATLHLFDINTANNCSLDFNNHPVTGDITDNATNSHFCG